MKEKISYKVFVRNLELSIIFLAFICIILSFLVWKNLNYTFSLIAGVFIVYLNFRSVKSDSIKTLSNVKNGLSPQKGMILYMSKFYIRLLATGILLYFFIKIVKLNPILILLGIFLVYFQLILMALKNLYFKKIEIT